MRFAHLQAAIASSAASPAPEAPVFKLKPLVLDVREPWELQKASLPANIAQVNWPMGEIFKLAAAAPSDRTAATPPALAAALAAPETDVVVVLCHGGVRSNKVTTLLASWGFTNVTNLEGGIDQYADECDRSIPFY